jgi:hypothetical protein
MAETNRSLIILGNGFDLAHDLKTSYHDFILWYLNYCIGFLNNINNNSQYSDTLLKIQKQRTISINRIDSIAEFVNYKETKQIHVLYENRLFVSIISQTKQFRWVDIESIYYNCLSDIAFDNLPNHKTKEERLKELNNGLDFLKEKLKEYLLKSDNTDIIKNNYIQSHIQKILIDSNFTVNNAKPVTYFLNFNYTPTIDRYIDNEMKIKYNIDIINIHGQINEKDTIIFGYGDEMDTKYEKIENKNNNKYLKHFKSFGYLKNIRLGKLLSFIEADSFNVYIMGHSCGISDRLLLNTIFQNDNCKIIKIFYHKIDDSNNDFIEKTMEISRSFTLAGKAKMRKIIVPFDQCEPLVKC